MPTADVNELSVRNLLALGQTDKTGNPGDRLYYSMHAWEAANTPEVALTDPTAAGEAAAKAGFNAATAGLPLDVVQNWFERSYESLPKTRIISARERIATAQLEGRALGYLTLKGSVQLEVMADSAFWESSQLVKEQHASGGTWDPYGTTTSSHHATFEGVRPNGSALMAISFAASGILQALRSRREEANTPSGLIKHGIYMVKHVGTNALAGTLAASKPLSRIKPIERARKNIATRILGGKGT